MKRLLAMFFVVSALTVTAAFGADVCAKYYGKGYCVDYIKVKTGKQQKGDAGTWSGNTKSKDVKGGDVAIFASRNHVAYVDSVNKDKKKNVVSVNISEWNYGPKWTDTRCQVLIVT